MTGFNTTATTTTAKNYQVETSRYTVGNNYNSTSTGTINNNPNTLKFGDYSSNINLANQPAKQNDNYSLGNQNYNPVTSKP